MEEKEKEGKEQKREDDPRRSVKIKKSISISIEGTNFSVLSEVVFIEVFREIIKHAKEAVNALHSFLAIASA